MQAHGDGQVLDGLRKLADGVVRFAQQPVQACPLVRWIPPLFVEGEGPADAHRSTVELEAGPVTIALRRVGGPSVA